MLNKYLHRILFSICLLLLVIVVGHAANPVIKYEDSVTIYRDKYGVPHIYGKNDAAAAFGFAYAQAEDNLPVVEENFINAIGRSAEIIGRRGILDDWLNRSLEITKLSKEEFHLLSPEIQEVCKGYAAGLNYYLKTHPNVKTKLLTKFEPWHPLAFIRYLYYQRVLLQFYSKIPRKSFKDAYQKIHGLSHQEMTGLNFINKKISGEGSNTWAVNGKKSASGNPLLLINPHLSFFGSSQVYEAHIMSDSGWNFTGYTRFGFPFPYVGFGEKLGWSSTDNAADLVDAYIETFERNANSLRYKYDKKWRKAKQWKEKILVKEDKRIVSKELTFRKTHHGPVISLQRNNYISVRMAKYEDPGWLDQWYWMTKARNLAEFKTAASKLDVQFGNYLYADVEGNIFYVYNGAIPKRSEKFDWSKPVDGSNPETEWKGYHSLDEIPQVLNPASGWIQNCNGTPLLSTTDRDNPKAKDFPNYMIPDIDNTRSMQSRRILNETPSFTFQSFTDKSYSTYLLSAEKELPALFEEWKNKENSKNITNEMRRAIEVLQKWDRVSKTDSVATTLYIYWSQKKRENTAARLNQQNPNLTALRETISYLSNRWKTWRVPWGKINRLQRIEANKKNRYIFDDSQKSLPIAGAPTWTGSIFTFWTNLKSKTKMNYGTGGNSYVSVIEFAPKVKARSLHYFGASGNPKSDHYFDQAKIYSTGKYKKVYLTLDDVKRNAKTSYKPGTKLN